VSKKILHVKDGRVAAVSLPEESLSRVYGTLVEVPLDGPGAVGDAYPFEAAEPAPVEPAPVEPKGKKPPKPAE
jgi:hypothetical protein